MHVLTSMKSNQKPRPKQEAVVVGFNMAERMTEMVNGALSTYDKNRLNKTNFNGE